MNAVTWAYERMTGQNFVVLDTETTSLDGEIVDLAILDAAGDVLFESLVRPIGRIEEGAREVHHISDEMLEDAPNFAEVWPRVREHLAGKTIITYNAKFDLKVMYTSLLANHIEERPGEKWECLMERYKHHIYSTRWQKLDVALEREGLPVSNTHRALADAQAAYSLLKHLAGKYQEPTPEDEAKAHKLVAFLKGAAK